MTDWIRNKGKLLSDFRGEMCKICTCTSAVGSEGEVFKSFPADDTRPMVCGNRKWAMRF